MLSRSFLATSLKSSIFNTLKSEYHMSSMLLTANTTEASSQDTKTNKEETPQVKNPTEELKEVKEKLQKCESDLSDFKDRMLRALAEAENTRIRMNKQVADAKIFGIQGFCKDLLEVADILHLAVVNTDPSKKSQDSNDKTDPKEQLNSMYSGLVMTEKCMLKIFAKHNLVQIIPAEGDKFDPNMHEAIFKLSLPDKTSGTVNVCTKIGFKLQDRVIRAAQVGVVS